MDIQNIIPVIDKNVAKIGNDLLSLKSDVDSIDTMLRKVLNNQNTLLANQKLILDELRKK